jgi:general secretion pathway protein I
MRRSSLGFTLLEAIVALAILAAGGMALFAALNGALRSVERIEDAARLDAATRNALARIEVLNPMEQPSGEEAFAGHTMRWTSVALEAPRDNLTDYLQPGYYEVGLFRLEVLIERDGRVERRFEVRKAGWRQVRFPEAM